MIWLSALVLSVVFAWEGSEALSNDEAPQNETSANGNECNAESLNTIVCENDSLRFCGPNQEMMSLPCVVRGKQGFCNCEKTACVAERPVCPEKTSKCLQLNTKLPENLNCHKFSYCDGGGNKSIFECPGDLIYDPNVEKCMDRYTAKCSRVPCPRPGNALQLIPFPQARNFYVLCYKGLGDVRKCKDEFYAVRDNECQFDCKQKNASGLFKDTNVKRCEEGRYYACKRSGTNFITVKAKCPPTLTFDENLGICTEANTCKPSSEPEGTDEPTQPPQQN